MPTSAQTLFSGARCEPYINPHEAFASMFRVKLPASVTYAAGTIVGEVTASPGTYKAYAPGSSDGSQNPVGVLEYGATTDSSGNILNATEWGTTGLTVPMFIQGTFRTQDLVGLDANAVTKLGGVLIEGTVTAGVVKF